MPELSRALEEGVWADGEPPVETLDCDVTGAIAAARPRAHPRLGRGRRALHDHRSALRRRAVAVLRVEHRLRREAPGVEAPSSAARPAAAHVPHPASGHRPRQGRVRRLPLVAGAPARPARSRARRCSRTTSSSAPPRRSARSPTAAFPRSSSRQARPMIAALGSAERVLAVGIGGGGDVVGALAVARARAAARHAGGRRRADLGAPADRPAAGSAPHRRDRRRRAGSTTDVALAGPDTTGPGGFRFAESHMARHLGEPVLLLDPERRARARSPRGLAGAAARARLRPRSCSSTSAATCSPTATRPGSRARSPTRSASPRRRSSSRAGFATLLARLRRRLRRRADARRGARARRRGRRARAACSARGARRRTTLDAARGGGRADPDRGERDGAALRARRDRHDDDPRRPPHRAAHAGRRRSSSSSTRSSRCAAPPAAPALVEHAGSLDEANDDPARARGIATELDYETRARRRAVGVRAAVRQGGLGAGSHARRMPGRRARAALVAAPARRRTSQPYRANDFGGFHDVLPPGTNGRANLVELAALPRDRRAPAAQRRPARRCTRACSARRRASTRDDDRPALQGLELRRRARRPGARLQPRPRRR